jgi:hypothetical protein
MSCVGGQRCGPLSSSPSTARLPAYSRAFFFVMTSIGFNVLGSSRTHSEALTLLSGFVGASRTQVPLYFSLVRRMDIVDLACGTEWLPVVWQLP